MMIGLNLNLKTGNFLFLTALPLMNHNMLSRTDKEIRQNYYFFAELNNGIKMNLKSNEGQLKWFSLDEINGLKMPFTAKYVTEHWLDVGRNTTDVYGGIADGEKVVFTEMPAF